MSVPTLWAVVLDCPDPLALGGFYARLFDWPAPDGDADWVSLKGPGVRVDFQRVDSYAAPTWPSGDRPQMFHLDLSVPDVAAGVERAVGLGAVVLDDSNSSFIVLADPAGHPFCLCQA